MRKFIVVILISFALTGCFGKKLKPLPEVDKTNPNVWTPEQCKDKPMIWWGQQGEDPSKNSDIWHCGKWKLYHEDVAP